MGEQLKIRQVKSGLGAQRKQRDTLRALGLKHHQDQVVQPDNPAIRGMIQAVAHLVEVEEVGSDG
ncbi:50S ribosomal protein L30 [Candidatus Palauibacter sp.]|uniref:50S ribosomal protein L30 n=1 Tax=Candidatus Palauibacter sp. TaxID=3101350 RepID=UPI003C6F9EDD